MTKFTITIAEITVEINVIFNSTKNFCEKYLSSNSPDFSLQITMDDIDFERKHSKMNKDNSGAEFSDEYLETLAVYRKIAEKLPFYNAFLFHASAIEVDGQAFIFTAKSGTGKSTHAELYRRKFGERMSFINDDKPIILLKDGKPYVCGTPWSGKRGLNTNKVVPLKAICLLKQNKINIIKKINSKEAFMKLITQAYRPSTGDSMSRFLGLFTNFIDNTAIYILECNKEPEAAEVSYNAMR